MDGVDRMYLPYYPDIAMPGATEAIDTVTRLAVDRSVQRIVLLSGRGEPEAKAAEDIVRASGVEWTVVRCAFFAQNFNENFLIDSIRSGVIALPAGSVAEPILDVDDIADVAVAALTDDAHVNQLYELTGPRLLTFAQAAAEISAAVGRRCSTSRSPPMSTERRWSKKVSRPTSRRCSPTCSRSSSTGATSRWPTAYSKPLATSLATSLTLPPAPRPAVYG